MILVLYGVELMQAIACNASYAFYLFLFLSLNLFFFLSLSVTFLPSAFRQKYYLISYQTQLRTIESFIRPH